MPVSIGAILSRGFQLVNNNRVFWVLGLALALLSSTISLNTQNVSPVTRPDFQALIGSSALWSCLSFIILAIFFVIHAAFEAGTIAGIDQADRGAPPTFQQAWAAGRAKMWPVLGLNLILVAIAAVIGIILFLILLVIFGAAIASFFSTLDSSLQSPGTAPPPSVAPAIGTSILGLFACLCGLVLLLIPVVVVLAGIIQFGERAIVLDNQGIGQAWSTGWRLFREQLGNVIVLLLTQLGIGIVTGLVAGLVGAVVGAARFAASTGNADSALSVVVGIVGGIVLWLIGGVITALPSAWGAAWWTLLYRAVTAPVAAGPGPAALYPAAGTMPGVYGAYPGAPGGYTTTQPYPGPMAPPSGYSVPGQYPGSGGPANPYGASLPPPPIPPPGPDEPSREV